MEVKAEAKIQYILGMTETLALKTAYEVLNKIYADLERLDFKDDDDINIPGWELNDLWTTKSFIKDLLKEVER